MKEQGIIALMGSGELTSSMVEVHKNLIARQSPASSAVFLDTPAGFQPNADQIAAGAVDYFRKRAPWPMTVASFKSHDHITDVQKVLLLKKLRDSGHIPTILREHVRNGGCLVAASAAALTRGRFTLPVYDDEAWRLVEEFIDAKGSPGEPTTLLSRRQPGGNK